MSAEGHFRAYAPKEFRADRLALIGHVNEVVEEYESQGYSLTVRQIYYQLVTKSLIPNSSRSYDKVQSAVNDGRMAGLISWTAIEDRGRQLMGDQTYDSPAQVLRAARASYRRDLWRTQYVRPEVWVEKQALEGVVQHACDGLRVDFYATKGYDSQSQSWRAGQRFARRMQKGQRTVVIHLGDHDPSGLDMTRDNAERLSLFAGYPVHVLRIALNMDQVETYRLPENPDNRPKDGDARSAAYREQYGDMGWELDALGPAVMTDLIRDAVAQYRDPALWDAALAEEVHELRELDDVIATFGGAGPSAEHEED